MSTPDKCPAGYAVWPCGDDCQNLGDRGKWMWCLEEPDADGYAEDEAAAIAACLAHRNALQLRETHRANTERDRADAAEAERDEAQATLNHAVYTGDRARVERDTAEANLLEVLTRLRLQIQKPDDAVTARDSEATVRRMGGYDVE